MDERQPDTRFLIFLFLLSWAVAAACTFELKDLPTQHALVMDAQRYDALARDIVERGWRPREVSWQAPLYPYLLAAVYTVSGRSAAAVRWLQALLAAVTAVLLAVATRRAFGSAAGRIAGLLAALYGPAVFYTPLLLKVPPLLFLEACLLLLLVPPTQGMKQRLLTGDGGLRSIGSPPATPRSPSHPSGGEGDAPSLFAPRPLRAGLAGLVLGIAALLQETLLALAPVLLLYLLFSSGPVDAAASGERAAGSPRRRSAGGGGVKSGLVAAAALACGVAAVLAPLGFARRHGGQELVRAGVNFYIGNSRGASGTYVALSAGSQDPARQRTDAERLAAAFAARRSGRPLAPISPASLSPAAVSALFWRESFAEIAEAPAAWLRLLLRKTRLFWNAYEIPDAEGYAVYRQESAVLRCLPLGFGAVAPLALAGFAAAWRSGPRERRSAVLLGLLAAGTCLPVVLFYVFGRYRIEVVPFLIPLAAFALKWTFGTIRSRRRAIGAIGAMGAAAGPQTASTPAQADSAAARPDSTAARGGAVSELAGFAVVLALGALAVNLPAYSAAERRQQDAAIYFNLGGAASRWADESYAAYLATMRASGGVATPEARERFAQAVRLTTRSAAYMQEAAAASPGFFAAEVQRAAALERQGSYLDSAGALGEALTAYGLARRQLASAISSGAGAGAPSEIQAAARGLLAKLDDDTAAALNNLGGKLIESGQLERAEAALRQAAALAPRLPAARGNLALCWLQRGLGARRGGAESVALRFFAASRAAYARAGELAEAAGRGDQAALYRQGFALAAADLSRTAPK
ncbi:MAG TPA: glycosyltransferase family 39 protein [Thermoanaerobaculia bacterium]|nr:glycosyltransferase family 39 protein [Thermoanaerobaculia bacterium]